MKSMNHQGICSLQNFRKYKSGLIKQLHLAYIPYCYMHHEEVQLHYYGCIRPNYNYTFKHEAYICAYGHIIIDNLFLHAFFKSGQKEGF